MSKTQKFLLLAGLVLALGIGALVLMSGDEPEGDEPEKQYGLASVNQYEGGVFWFGNGFYAGLNQELSVSNDGDIATTGDLTASATTTITRSYDGFMAGGGITPASVATGTAITLYTHSGGPAICDAGQSAFYADSTGYSPSLIWQVGTSSSAGASINLLASTTIPTTTDALIPSSAESLFRLNAGDEITAYAADGSVAPGASTTNFANWDIEYQVRCWLIGG